MKSLHYNLILLLCIALTNQPIWAKKGAGKIELNPEEQTEGTPSPSTPKPVEQAVAKEQTPAEKAREEKQFKGRTLTLRDFGAHDLGFLTLPSEPPQSGVLLVPGIFGMDERIKTLCDLIASHGHVALAVDLHNGTIPVDQEMATRLQKNLRPDSARSTIEAGINLLSDSPKWRSAHVILAAYGPNCNLLTRFGNEPKEALAGIVWFEPEGELNEREFRKLSVPLLALYTKRSPQQLEFIAKLNSFLEEEKKKTTIVQLVDGSPGFSMDLTLEETRNEALNTARNFWKDCANGKYMDRSRAVEKFQQSFAPPTDEDEED